MSTLGLFAYLAIITTASRAEPLTGDVSTLSANKYTFIVSISRTFDLTPDNPLGHVCGGALVTKRHVLTAASCFEANRTVAEYFVFMGHNDLTHSSIHWLDNLIKFDDWLASRRRNCQPARSYGLNDIAVVRLLRSTRIAVDVAKIWNISPHDLAEWDLTVRTAGWTRSPNNQPPRYMLEADFQLINRDVCLQRMGLATNDPSYENFFCTRGVGSGNTVLDGGDKGSPVFVEYEPGQYLVVGINLSPVPATNDANRYLYQRNTHISVHYYCNFLKRTTDLRYL